MTARAVTSVPSTSRQSSPLALQQETEAGDGGDIPCPPGGTEAGLPAAQAQSTRGTDPATSPPPPATVHSTLHAGCTLLCAPSYASHLFIPNGFKS